MNCDVNDNSRRPLRQAYCDDCMSEGDDYEIAQDSTQLTLIRNNFFSEIILFANHSSATEIIEHEKLAEATNYELVIKERFEQIHERFKQSQISNLINNLAMSPDKKFKHRLRCHSVETFSVRSFYETHCFRAFVKNLRAKVIFRT